MCSTGAQHSCSSVHHIYDWCRVPVTARPATLGFLFFLKSDQFLLRRRHSCQPGCPSLHYLPCHASNICGDLFYSPICFFIPNKNWCGGSVVRVPRGQNPDQTGGLCSGSLLTRNSGKKRQIGNGRSIPLTAKYVIFTARQVWPGSECSMLYSSH